MSTDKVTYTAVTTNETCQIHRGTLLRWVEMSNDVRGFYCHACAAPSYPATRITPAAELAMERYERQIDRRAFWRRVLGWWKR